MNMSRASRRAAHSVIRFVCAFAFLASLSPANAEDARPSREAGVVFALSLGGKLYDNHFVMTETEEPKGLNPDYPDNVSAGYLGTWRCVSCHGWDYRGAEGERGKLATSSAFKSLAPMAELEPSAVQARFAGAHPELIEGGLTEQAARLVSLFLSGGQIDRDAVLDKEGKAKGKAEDGQMIYEGACMNCHQVDGRAFLRGEAGDKPSLGWVSRNRPEQVLHKIMNGFPGTDMLAMRFLDQNSIADLVAYLQTLDPGQK